MPLKSANELNVSSEAREASSERPQDSAARSDADDVRLVERKRLSVRRVMATGVSTGTDSATVAGAAGAASAPGAFSASRAATPGTAVPSSAAVPLKRLTAGRKELSILHAGSTYLLRVTKSNKLILTKA